MTSTETPRADSARRRPAACGRAVAAGRAAARRASIRSIVPVVLALVAGGILLARARPQPVHLLPEHLAAAASRAAPGRTARSAMAPLLLIAAGLTRHLPREHLEPRLQRPVPARAAFVSGYGPSLVERRPALARVRRPLPDRRRRSARSGRSIPAVLKARYGTNEIITTLMMSFIGDRPREHPDQGAVPGSDDADCRRRA